MEIGVGRAGHLAPTLPAHARGGRTSSGTTRTRARKALASEERIDCFESCRFCRAACGRARSWSCCRPGGPPSSLAELLPSGLPAIPGDAQCVYRTRWRARGNVAARPALHRLRVWAASTALANALPDLGGTAKSVERFTLARLLATGPYLLAALLPERPTPSPMSPGIEYEDAAFAAGFALLAARRTSSSPSGGWPDLAPECGSLLCARPLRRILKETRPDARAVVPIQRGPDRPRSVELGWPTPVSRMALMARFSSRQILLRAQRSR